MVLGIERSVEKKVELGSTHFFFLNQVLVQFILQVCNGSSYNDDRTDVIPCFYGNFMATGLGTRR